MNLVPRTEGLMLGGHSVFATGITIAGPGMRGQIKTNMGGGGGLQVGYGFSPRLMVILSADVAKQSTTYRGVDGSFGLAHVELGGRFTFPQAGKRYIPYVVGFIGQHGLAAHSDQGGVSATLRLSGGHFGAGGGLLYALSPQISLDAAVTAARGKFNKAELSGDVQSEGSVDVNNSTNMRLKVGFSWHPSSRGR
jgi:hypothetical protein